MLFVVLHNGFESVQVKAFEFRTTQLRETEKDLDLVELGLVLEDSGAKSMYNVVYWNKTILAHFETFFGRAMSEDVGQRFAVHDLEGR